MKPAVYIALVYALMSFLTTASNIVTQAIWVLKYKGAFSIELSVLAETAVGFPIKYSMEKKHVFAFKTVSLGHDTSFFTLYALMGIFTTAIFWSVEFVFHFLFDNDVMRYLSGALGLAIGSFIKYRLDKRFVFKRVRS